ncbi:MAG: hypothetical protein JXR49_06830 [Acidobacteria bacterium]|nr:hypothetical protein [Acidobacteriota bacterium]
MRIKIAAFTLILFVSAASASLRPAFAQDNSSTNPADIGSRVRSMIELGSVYSNIYDIAITVRETVRGEKAIASLKAVDPGVGMPPEGFEYVLARIRFELKGRAVSDTIPFDLGRDPLQWVALASDLTEYTGVSATPPKPALVGRVNPGDSMEGWVAFAVDKKDSGPVMVFDPDTGGATGRGRTLFFKLY